MILSLLARQPEAFQTTASGLEGFQEITTPAPISFWPETTAWYFVSALLVALLGWWIAARVARYQADRYRREALQRLDELDRLLARSPMSSDALLEISVLLKRVALSAWPRTEVAELSGMQWIHFLESHHPSVRFNSQERALLGELQYVPPAQLDALELPKVEALMQKVRKWVRGHEVDGRSHA